MVGGFNSGELKEKPFSNLGSLFGRKKERNRVGRYALISLSPSQKWNLCWINMSNIEGKASIPIHYLGLLETSWATLHSAVGHSVARQRDAEGKVECWSVDSADREPHLKLGQMTNQQAGCRR